MTAIQEFWDSRESYDIYFAARVVPKNYVPYHWHNAYELILIIEGNVKIMLKQTEYLLTPGSFLIINPQEIHSCISVNGDSSITAIIPSDFFKKYAPHDPLPIFPHTFDGESIETLKKLLLHCGRLHNQGKNGNYLAFYSELFHFLDKLYELRINDTMGVLPLLKENEEKRLKIITDYIAMHYSEPITLHEIASQVHLQPNYFCRFFQKITGISFLKYLNEYRIMKIYGDIVATRDPIKDILVRHGFYDYKSFRKYFYKKYQCTPTELRKSQATADPAMPSAAPGSSPE